MLTMAAGACTCLAMTWRSMRSMRGGFRAVRQACMLVCAPLQALPRAVGASPATGDASDRALHFPELLYFETHPNHPAVRAAAKAWGKAVMLSCWMGHLTPWRPEWFANLCHPDHWPESCPHGGCNVVGCRGNGLRRSADGRQYSLHVHHHKTSDNSSVRDRAPITYPLPPSLFIWMDVWCCWCWPVVAAPVRVGGRRLASPPCVTAQLCVCGCAVLCVFGSSVYVCDRAVLS